MIAKAEHYRYAEHHVKAKLGRIAEEKILNGEDYGEAIAEMEKAWGDYCDQRLD